MQKQKNRKQVQSCKHISLGIFLNIMSIWNKISFSQCMSIGNDMTWGD